MSTTYFYIDQELCTGCGACVRICHRHLIALERKFPVQSHPELCLNCQHCLAACPVGALSVGTGRPWACRPLSSDVPTLDAIENLVVQRRSCRHFKNLPVPRELISRLVFAASHAPAGGGRRELRIVVLDNPKATFSLKNELYSNIQAMGRDGMPKGLRQSFYAFPEKIASGEDVVFRGAPHLILVTAGAGAQTPQEDAAGFMTTFDLLAHSAGLATLWNGQIPTLATALFPSIGEKLGLRSDDQTTFCMLFGYSDEHYYRTTSPSAPHIDNGKNFLV